MSKSLGNLYTLEDIKAQGYDPQAVRYVLLSGSYRQPLNFTFDSLKAATKALNKLHEFARKIGCLDLSGGSTLQTEFGPFLPVQQAVLNDLNTPDALGKLFSLVREHTDALLGGKYDPAEDEMKHLRAGFHAVLDLFGFKFSESVEEDAPAEVTEWAEQRWLAKQSRDWAKADLFRDKIQQAGWAVKDSKDTYALQKLA